eukprot:1514330-Rhodomonas_salina.4
MGTDVSRHVPRVALCGRRHLQQLQVHPTPAPRPISCMLSLSFAPVLDCLKCAVDAQQSG